MGSQKPCKKCGCLVRYTNGKCRDCSSVRQKAWSKENPEYAKQYRDTSKQDTQEYWKSWYSKNKSLVLESKRASYVNTPEVFKGRSSEYRQQQPDKCAEYAKYYAEANPDKIRIHKQNRRARTRGVLSVGIVAKLWELQNGKCACCGVALKDDYHVDHIMPLALGGSNTDDNVQLLLSRCNHMKHAKHPADYMRERGLLL